MSKKDFSLPQRYSILSVPVRHLGRFVKLPAEDGKTCIILLEDVVRFCLPQIFSFFGYDEFSAHIIKVTRDAEMDIDNDVSTSLMQKLEKGLKKRKVGIPVRFIFDKDIDPNLLTYLTKRLGLSRHGNIFPGGRIHNFKDFMNFPDVFNTPTKRKRMFVHPALVNKASVTEQVLKQDILLSFPYHTFNSVIDIPCISSEVQ